MRGRIAVASGKPKDSKGTFFRLLRYMKPYWVQAVVVVLFILAATFCTTFAPKVLGSATTTIFNGLVSGGGIDFVRVAQTLLFLAAVYIMGASFNYFQQFLMSGVAQKTMYTLRLEVDHKLARLPLKYFDTQTHGEILSRVTNDVDTIANSLQQSLTQIVTSTVTVVFIIIMMLSVSPALTLVALVTLPLSLLVSMGVVKKSQPFFRGQQKSIGELGSHVEEMYSGHDVVKLFGLEKKSTDKFDEINEEWYGHSWKAQFASSVMMPLITFIGNLGYVLVCVFGGIMAAGGSMTVGGIQAFIQYLRLFNQPINQLANIANILQSTLAAAERVFEVLDEREESPDTPNITDVSKVRGEVEFQNVSFGYTTDRLLMKHLSIQVNDGETVAIVGPTGAGKTTLVNLLMRFYEINSGKILVGGIPIWDMSRKRLRSIFGMVLQDTWLFQGSIRENLAYGRLDATQEEIEAAARAAHAHGFIKQLPGGYDFELNEEASNISQGQKQLLTIARAILANPEILILDEATSSVDTRTEVLIQKAMKNLMHGRTSFVIAHRLSTIRDADNILVMRDGDIIEQGTHSALMAQGGFYAELYNSQFAENNAI